MDSDKSSHRIRSRTRCEGHYNNGEVILIMEQPDKKFWAYAKTNKDFVFIETYSGYWNCLPDPEGKQFNLLASSEDETIGHAIVEALAASRFLHPKDYPDFFDIRGRVVPQYEEWVKSIMDEYGYKTKRAMFNGMKSCGIESQNGMITLRPSYHEKLEAWSGKGITEADYVVISANSPPANIGAALRLALSRCKG
ncbi:Protein of uncharacterised function (DUF1436) [Yersinia rohdei]|uniref:Protein of uncharacterized function (DUF1436) n=2 Tax=Yersinia rohdei TaxID=29485 RepID=A0A0U1HTE7_YERRO|nr:Protein of uncharacterised function (DUF1436) [Yersinia rohdei]